MRYTVLADPDRAPPRLVESAWGAVPDCSRSVPQAARRTRRALLASLRDPLFSMRLLGQRRGGTGPGADAYRVTAGRSPEQSPVLPAELGRAVVPDAVPDAGDVVRAVRQQQSRRLQPDVLLELDRAHRRHRLEVPVEGRDAQPRKLCHLLDPERPCVVFPDPLGRPGDVAQAAVGKTELADGVTLVPGHQPPEDLPLDQRGQRSSVTRPAEQAEEPHDSVEQLVGYVADRDPR